MLRRGVAEEEGRGVDAQRRRGSMDTFGTLGKPVSMSSNSWYKSGCFSFEASAPKRALGMVAQQHRHVNDAPLSRRRAR